MSKYVAAIDQGTTSTRFIIFDHGGNIVAVDQKEHEQIFPKPGWVEHDPLEIWERVQEVMARAIEKVGRDKEWIPKMDAKVREGLYSGWKKAVTRTFGWVE